MLLQNNQTLKGWQSLCLYILSPRRGYWGWAVRFAGVPLRSTACLWSCQAFGLLLLPFIFFTLSFSRSHISWGFIVMLDT